MAAPTHEQIRQLYRHFKAWVQQNVEQGIDGDGTETDYISNPKLRGYWTHDRIGTVLGPNDKDVYIDVIQFRANTDDNSLPLPTPDARLRRLPAPFDDPDGPQAWSHFSEYQWKFLPLRFISKEGIIDRVYPPRTLDRRHIIPITIEGELSQRSGRGARVIKVQPHEASGLPPGSITLKIYDRDRFGDEFMKERHTYTTIRNLRRADAIDVSKYFLHYHGCYIQENECVLLIEYANQGSLLDFFRKNWYLPRTAEEAQDLWRELGHLFKGLALLHNGGKYSSSIHQDIKPANIFVSATESSSRHLSFKFGDFGTSSVTPIAGNGDTTGYDNGGTKMYSAPELCGIDPEIHMSERISWQVDMWSFGCVLLDCGVWMTMHERGRIEFREERVKETRSLKQNTLSKAGYDGAFHDGEHVLSTVTNKIEEVWQLDSPVARLVGRMMAFIQKEMLVADVERLNAQQLQSRFQDAINGPMSPSSPGVHRMSSQISQYSTPLPRTSTDLACEAVVPGVRSKGKEEASWKHRVSDRRDTGHVSPQPTTIVGRLPVPYEETPPPSATSSTQSIRPELRQQPPVDLYSNGAKTLGTAPAPNRHEDSDYTINRILEWIPKHKAHQEHMPRWLDQPLGQLRGRDQCFIFDNSASMAEHWSNVKRTGDALTYILKNIDPDGFEIHMTNSGESLKRKNRNGLFEGFGYFHQHRPGPDLGTCAMETVLSNILGAVVKKALAPSPLYGRFKSRQVRGVSVYVFTNGVWEGRRSRDESSGEAGGVENAIKTAVKRLQEANQMRTFLSIQFIRFGDDPEGRRRMQWLDDGIKTMTGGWDIVDTTHHTESVKKMIIGAISGCVDDAVNFLRNFSFSMRWALKTILVALYII
ncbi:hypothetical protein F4824DRAFT_391140 [Ustulina deusta]|nr:hypothetical protein F4824DRAFT_391140 [Ustulina deusta]